MITMDRNLFLLLYQSSIKEGRNIWYLFYFFEGYWIFHFFIFIQISMQRIQEMRKIFENIDYINWKGELFYGNEILEITNILWILARSCIYISLCKTYLQNSKKIVNFYTKLYELSTRKVSQFSHPLNNEECGLPSLS